MSAPTARTRKASNVVPLHTAKQTTAEIVAEVQAHRQQEEHQVTRDLQALLAEVQQRHRERAAEAVTIGAAMTGPALSEWLEIGRRMLGQRGKRA